MNVRRIIIIIVILAVIAAGAYLIFGRSTDFSTAQNQDPTPSPPVIDQSGDVTAEGRLVPASPVPVAG